MVFVELGVRLMGSEQQVLLRAAQLTKLRATLRALKLVANVKLTIVSIVGFG